MNGETTPTADGKNQSLFNQFEHIRKVLGTGARIELVYFLSQAHRSVAELTFLSGYSPATVSQHLQVLKRTGLVKFQKGFTDVRYKLADGSILRLWQVICKMTEHRIAELEQVARTFLKNPSALERLTLEALEWRLAEGDITVIDVRPFEDFAVARISGAISVPSAELEAHLKGLCPGRQIAAYGLGSYCVQSHLAVDLLRDRGLKSFRLEVGMPNWRTAGERATLECELLKELAPRPKHQKLLSCRDEYVSEV